MTIQIINEVHSFVYTLFLEKLSDKFVYHNFEHTEQIVENVFELLGHYQLSKEEEEIVLLAAWLHAIGYTVSKSRSKQHSADIAKRYLYAYGYEMPFIENVQNTILSLQSPRKPQNILENILCDATLKDLSTKEFDKRSLLLRKEWELNCFALYDSLTWYKNMLKFLEGHTYFTEYAQQHWSTNDNQEFLMKKIKNLE